MVELTRTFSFREQVFPHILRERAHSHDKDVGKVTDADYEQIKDEMQAHIVGQERDGTVLVSWTDKSPNGSHKVSYVAAYEPATSHFKTLFTHDKKVQIIGASVNQEKTLLAFTTIEPFISQFDEPPGTEHPGIYKSFLAEIHPQNRIFSLYIERQTYQRVQFLYGIYHCYGSSSKKESHMLFFHHKKAVGLYHIPMARIGDRGMILSSQPRTEQVGGPFVWAQWDIVNERLYYVYKEFKDANLEEGDYELMLSAYQFSEKIPHFCVLNMPLPFDMQSCCCEISSSTPQYVNFPLTQTISEKQFNMQVVTMPGGSLFICLQHGLEDQNEPPEEESARVSPMAKNATSEKTPITAIEYSVYLLHHDCSLHCILNCVPQHLAGSCTLFFSSFHDHLLVLLPGYVMHLLDGSAEHEPCHHIILQDDNIPKFSLEKLDGELPVLLHFNKQQITSVQPVPNILDHNSGDGFELSFNKGRLVEIFSKTHLSITRLSLLHLAVVHMKDPLLLRKMIEHLCYDPCSPECSDLLKEYLVGSTHTLLKRALDRERDRDVLRLIPFTCVDTFRGHLEESLDKRRIARLTCTLCRDTKSEFKNDKKKPLDTFWSVVQENKLYSKRPTARFSFKSIPTVDDDDSDEEIEPAGQHAESPQQAASQTSSVKSIFKRFSMKKYSSSESLASQSSTKSGDFLESCEEDRKPSEIKKQTMVKDTFATYLQNHLPPEIKDKARNIAKEYVKYQSVQTEALLRLFWTGLGYSSDTNPFAAHLNVQATAQEIALLQVVERYFTSVTDLKFPLPSGFQTFFTTLAFHCLDPRMFLQYLDNRVLQLTGQFISRLVQDCRGECENAAFVFQILSRLKHEKSKQAMQRWDHPLSKRYLAQQITDELLSQEFAGEKDSFDSFLDGSSRLSGSASSLDSCDDTSFRPLATLMSTLKERAAVLTAEGKINHGNVFNLRNISDVALIETRREVDGNLATVPF